MRRLKIKFSFDDPVDNAFVYFALALDEQLYDLTDDSFKAPALNTFSRTLELQVIAQANFTAGISKDALKPFIEELEWSIAKDPVLSPQQRALCKVHVEGIVARLEETDRIARAVAGLRIVLGDYFAAIQQAILNTVENFPSHKSQLFDLASAFIIQAEIEGFPRRHTYHIAQNVLIRELKYSKTIDSRKILREFFTYFSIKERKFKCLFLGEGNPEKFPKLVERFGFDVLDEQPSWPNLNTQQRQFLASRKGEQKWLLFDGITAVSPVDAHETAVSTFEQFASVVRFFEHLHEVTLSRLSLTQDDETKQTYMSHEAPDPMHCWVGYLKPTERDLLLLGDVIHREHLASDSAIRLARAVRFHRTALLSNSAENQLIDLWAALEGLLPEPKRESLRIEYFSESLLPALTLTYPEKLFSSAYCDLLKVSPAAKAVVEGLPGEDTRFSKFLRLVLCAEHAGERDVFVTALRSTPLLLNKMWKLSEAFKSRAAIQQTLRQHRKKVKWHLARIYFTRNSIMHSAASLPHLRTLVENMHVYVDTLIRSIARVAHASPETLTIEGALQYLAAWEKFRLEAITHDGKENSAAPTKEEVWALVFGQDMALAPDKNEDLAVKL